MSSIEEAIAHCSSVDSEVLVSNQSTEGTNPSAGAAQQPAAPGAELAGLPPGEVIAYDEYGQPSIVRQVKADTGVARTIVRNEDGSHRVFGENTVASLTSSSREEAAKWASSLSPLQLRGLVHEVGQRLLESSRSYHAKLAELESLGERLNYQFFGLSAGAADKELDNAYRRMAKKMHPDKNGGTEEAKTRFQHMKERYEALKRRRGGEEEAEAGERGRASGEEGPEDAGGAEEEPPGGGKPSGEDDAREDPEEDGKQAAPQHGAGGEAREEERPERERPRGRPKARSIEYDPGDAESMVQTVSKMVAQLKHIEVQSGVVLSELQRALAQLPPETAAAGQ